MGEAGCCSRAVNNKLICSNHGPHNWTSKNDQFWGSFGTANWITISLSQRGEPHKRKDVLHNQWSHQRCQLDVPTSCRSNWACSNSFWVETFLGDCTGEKSMWTAWKKGGSTVNRTSWFCSYVDWSFKWSSEKGITTVVFGACANPPVYWWAWIDDPLTYTCCAATKDCSTRPALVTRGFVWSLGFLDGRDSEHPSDAGPNISSGSRYLFKHQNLKHLPRKASSQNETFCTSQILLDARYIKYSVIRLIGPWSHRNRYQSLYSTC